MQKKAWYSNVLVAFVLILFSFNSAHAESGVAVGARISTLGVGGEVTAQLVPNLNIRLGGNGAEYDYDGTESGIEYDFDLKLLSGTALVDWHPWSGGFRVSGGAMVNGNEVDFQAKSVATYTIGDTTYTTAEVGTLSGEIDFNALAPYVGIGWGNAVDKNKRWGFTLDLGVVYQGTPDVELRTNGSLASDAAFRANLEREKTEFRKRSGFF